MRVREEEVKLPADSSLGPAAASERGGPWQGRPGSPHGCRQSGSPGPLVSDPPHRHVGGRKEARSQGRRPRLTEWK